MNKSATACMFHVDVLTVFTCHQHAAIPIHDDVCMQGSSSAVVRRTRPARCQCWLRRAWPRRRSPRWRWQTCSQEKLWSTTTSVATSTAFRCVLFLHAPCVVWLLFGKLSQTSSLKNTAPKRYTCPF
jgi:hypothetical protein